MTNGYLLIMNRGAIHPSQFQLYGNPAAMSLERERLGIPPAHHVGMDPNDPMVVCSNFYLKILYSMITNFIQIS